MKMTTSYLPKKLQMKKIQHTLNQINPLKIPEVDGMHEIFYKKKMAYHTTSISW